MFLFKKLKKKDKEKNKEENSESTKDRLEKKEKEEPDENLYESKSTNLGELFSYKNMAQSPHIEAQGFSKSTTGIWLELNGPYSNIGFGHLQNLAGYDSSEKIPQFILNSEKRKQQHAITKTKSTHAGWKFQISLDDSDPRNIAKAWDLAILPHLLANSVNLAKIVAPKYTLSTHEDGVQHGKQVTIYAYRNPEKSPEEWQKILQSINDSLHEHAILPGPRARGQTSESESFEMRSVPGSDFMTYQYDGDEKGKYTDKKSYELPKGVSDIGEQIEVKSKSSKQLSN